MDKCWVTGIGQDADWWLGYWDDTRPADDQPNMAQLFRLNEKWPYPLTPSEYVQRQFHVSFQDDPVAVACRHITGLSTIVWGNDYPHAEGTFRGSRELIEPAVRRRSRRRAGRDGRRHPRRPPRLRSAGARRLNALPIPRMKMSANGFATSRADDAAAGLEPQIRVVVHAEPRERGEPRVDVAELAGVDAGLQDRLDPALVLAPAHAELLGALGGERGELVEEHPHVIGIAVDDVEQLVAEHRRAAPTASPPALGDASAPSITSSITRSWIAARSSSFDPM